MNQVCGVPTSGDIHDIGFFLSPSFTVVKYLYFFLIFSHLTEININYKPSEIQKFIFWLLLLPRAWTMAYASNENVSYKCFKTILCWTLILQVLAIIKQTGSQTTIPPPAPSNWCCRCIDSRCRIEKEKTRDLSHI